MREIKFRGKRIDNGQWVYGQYFVSPLTDENSGLPLETGWFFLTGEKRHCIARDGVSFVIDIETLGQFSGLKDDSKNKKEVYEGDIIEKIGWEGEYYIVEFIDCAFYASSVKRNIPAPWRTKYIKLDELLEFQVVGNIYENPELLESNLVR